MVWRVTKSAVEKWAERLLHIHDSPQRTARAFALGVLIGFSPFLGLHTAIGLAIAFAFDLNRVAVLLGMYLNLPWLIPPFYAVATALGAWLLRSRMPADFLPRLQTIWDIPGWLPRFDALAALLRPLLPAYLLGSSILAVILAMGGYVAAVAFIRARQAYVARHPGLR